MADLLRPTTMKAFDLSALEKHYRVSKEFRKLAGLIRSFTSMKSVETDLKRVCGMINLASQNAMTDIADLGRQRQDQAMIGQALLGQAIMIYAAATISTSKHRIVFQAHDQMEGKMRARHERIKNIRDYGIGHFGPGDPSTRKIWTEDRAVIVLERGGAIYEVYTRRTNYLAQTIIDLQILVAYLLPILKEKISVAEKGLDTALGEAINLDDGVRKALKARPFNPYEFFATEEAAQDCERDAGTGQTDYSTLPTFLDVDTLEPPQGT